jgi:hypothetical protein
LAAGCGTESAVPTPSAATSHTIRVEGSRTIPVARSLTLAQAVSNLADGFYRGRVASVDSYVNTDDEIYSDITLSQVDGGSVTYTVFGGTVPGRELKAIAKDPDVTQRALDEPVTMAVDDAELLPAVGQDVVVFYERIPGAKHVRGDITLAAQENQGVVTYGFPGRPAGFLVTGRWAAPASESELNDLLAAVGKTKIRVG